MNANELRRRFPRASNAFIDANSETGRELRPAKPKQDPPPTLDKVAKRKATRILCPIVRFSCVRKRLLDPDAITGACKDLIDGLKHAHLIIDDSPQHIELQVTQRKPSPNEEECTVIEIEYR